jgi:hypothetical protein
LVSQMWTFAVCGMMVPALQAHVVHERDRRYELCANVATRDCFFVP